MRIFMFIGGLCVAGAAAAWVLSAPDVTDPALPVPMGDAARGALVFTAAGCASCHVAPGATETAQPVLSGGQRFASDFGTFIAPNISTDVDQGIGAWSTLDLLTALRHGTSPAGQHYYPALPYAAYSRMTDTDVADLRAYLATLPADATPSQPHEVGFPFNIRRALGFWKLLFLREDWVLADAPTPELERGRYIVEALAHCGECHTPRNALGGLQRDRWLAGAPNPNGKGTIPNITPAGLTWSSDEIIEYLTTGFTPEYDTVGGHMVAVVENLAKLPDSDRAAVAAYLKAIPKAE
ncbi:c-type cytochrome [Pseudogemmobacter sp. W21_MBD1_M6]|uniref:c-type cytochrome n=1 Tax=Pseudogemmobacter sp. W21_MBD1_M6 TaxID=3240271 RepID=UPI003F9CEF94